MANVISLLQLVKASREVALIVKNKTGKAFLYHFLDYIHCFIKYGCSDNHYMNEGFYRLRSFDRKNTVTKGRKSKICRAFNDEAATKFFSNKVLFNKTFQDYIKRDWIYTKEASARELISFISSHDKIIAKPVNMAKGKGIHMLERTGSIEADADQLLKEDWLLEEYICQHPAMRWGSNSVNSIRVISVIDNKGVLHILKAGMRCGVGDAIVDNFSAGGGFYPLNLEYGFIDGYGEFGNQINYSGIHPGTDKCAIGFQVPHWSEVLSTVGQAAFVIPSVRYVGWDVAILPDGVELIEGNNGPGCTLLECIGEKRGFYKEIMSYR